MRTDEIDMMELVDTMILDRQSMKHLRIGQWLLNAAGSEQKLFYAENGELLKLLDAFRIASESNGSRS